jgi:hypothetical protein
VQDLRFAVARNRGFFRSALRSVASGCWQEYANLAPAFLVQWVPLAWMPCCRAVVQTAATFENTRTQAGRESQAAQPSRPTRARPPFLIVEKMSSFVQQKHVATNSARSGRPLVRGTLEYGPLAGRAITHHRSAGPAAGWGCIAVASRNFAGRVHVAGAIPFLQLEMLGRKR